MGDDGQGIDRLNTRSNSIGKPETPAQCLLGENIRGGSPKGDDGIEVANIPPFFQLVDVNHHVGLVLMFESQETSGCVLAFLTFGGGIDADDAALVASTEEVIGFDGLPQGLGMVRVLSDHEHKGVNLLSSRLTGADVEFGLHVLMAMNTIFQLNPLQLLWRHAVGAEIFACRNGRLLHEAVRHGLSEAVIEDHVLKALGAGADGTRGCGQFQSKNGMQFANRPPAGLAAITVRFVHQQNEVGQLGQIIKIALAYILLKLLDSAAFLVDLIDVEDVDDGGLSTKQVATPRPWSQVSPVTRTGGIWANSAMPLKTYFSVF
jgi:hypothetical protein